VRAQFKKLVQFFELKRGKGYPKGHSFVPLLIITVPEEVSGLSVLFTVLYICKRSINKRMTKKAKLQTHYLLNWDREERGERLEAQQIILIKKCMAARNRAPRNVQRKLLWPLSLSPMSPGC